MRELLLIAVLALLAICAVLLAFIAVRLVRRPAPAAAAPLTGPAPAWFERTLRKKVVVHLKNDQSVEGALMEQTLDGVILRAAELLGNDGKRTSMAGETFVPRENIAFSQLDE